MGTSCSSKEATLTRLEWRTRPLAVLKVKHSLILAYFSDGSMWILEKGHWCGTSLRDATNQDDTSMLQQTRIWRGRATGKEGLRNNITKRSFKKWAQNEPEYDLIKANCHIFAKTIWNRCVKPHLQTIYEIPNKKLAMASELFEEIVPPQSSHSTVHDLILGDGRYSQLIQKKTMRPQTQPPFEWYEVMHPSTTAINYRANYGHI